MSTPDPFLGLQPDRLWSHFRAITRIPRPSKREGELIAYIESWAARLGLEVRRDAAGNLCVVVPATAGRAAAPVVVGQAHLDMVCAPTEDVGPYNPSQGRIHVERDGDWLIARETTLGADNGIGVAALLAVAEDPGVVHGPLELLFTLDEESGLSGASQLDPAIIHGRILLNLDTEDDDIFTIGCAGGHTTVISWRGPQRPVGAGEVALEVSVAGLQGGHSGIDINKGRANAIRVLVRLLEHARRAGAWDLSQIEGGDARNAIPSWARAIILIPREAEPALRESFRRQEQSLQEQYQGLDDGLTVMTRRLDSALVSRTFEGSGTAVDLLRAISTGVIALSQDIPGLVETSNNLGMVRTKGDTIEIVCAARSSLAPAMAEVVGTLKALARLAGGDFSELESYPGWKPSIASPTLAIAMETYRKLFGEDPKYEAIHAGLECGLIGDKVPAMDMISFGPTIRDVHRAGEKVSIPSVAKFYRFLSGLLENLAHTRD
jgi:dipeptidase D